MADTVLYAFWLLVTALFTFAAVYAWIVYRLVREPLPGELVWLFLGMAFVFGCNAFIRSGQVWVDPEHVVVLSRAASFVSGINAVVAVVLLAQSYNGRVAGKISLWRQARKLWQDLRD